MAQLSVLLSRRSSGQPNKQPCKPRCELVKLTSLFWHPSKPSVRRDGRGRGAWSVAWLWLLCVFAPLIGAATPTINAQQATPPVAAATPEVVQQLQTPQTLTAPTPTSTPTPALPKAQNQIPLLDNRFRIDFAVDEITLLFFRKKGAPSIILVRPDGSKIYARTARDHAIEWHDDKTFDLIKMKNPMPGPWQAVGQIQPDSKIMVLTDIELKVDPLPRDLMVGESIKVTATLANGGKPINARDFRDVLALDMLLISTQKAEYDNFTDTVKELGAYKDDGQKYDEKPRDAVFTAGLQLDFAAGEWIPKYMVKTPLYTRELLHDPIVILRAPIAHSVEQALTDDDKHQLIYQITDGPIDAKSLSLQGRIRFPTNEVQSFTLAEQDSNERRLAIANTGTGTYRIEQQLFGKTKGGRDFVLNLPEITFAATGAKVDVPSTDETSAESAGAVGNSSKEETGKSGVDKNSDSGIDGKNVAAKATDATAAPDVSADTSADTAASNAADDNFPLGLVIGINIVILVLGGGAVFVVMNPNAKEMSQGLWQKANPMRFLPKKNNNPPEPTAEELAAAARAKAQKNGDSNDILDLSLPDD